MISSNTSSSDSNFPSSPSRFWTQGSCCNSSCRWLPLQHLFWLGHLSARSLVGICQGPCQTLPLPHSTGWPDNRGPHHETVCSESHNPTLGRIFFFFFLTSSWSSCWNGIQSYAIQCAHWDKNLVPECHSAHRLLHAVFLWGRRKDYWTKQCA